MEEKNRSYEWEGRGKISIVSTNKSVLKPSLCILYHRGCDCLLFIHLAIVSHSCDQSALFWDSSCLNDICTTIQTLSDWLNVRWLLSNKSAPRKASPVFDHYIYIHSWTKDSQMHVVCEKHNTRREREKGGCLSKSVLFQFLINTWLLGSAIPIIIHRHQRCFKHKHTHMYVHTHDVCVCLPSVSVRCCVFYWPAINV